MRAAIYEEFRGPITVRDVPDPTPARDGVVMKVKACGICRSDWHGWMGNDPDIGLPHVPGHELAGEIAAVGSNIKNWKAGDCVTVPFVCGCGDCERCHAGDQHICDRQFQPGFTAWGGFADYVAIEYADANLVALPEQVDLTTAASLGCRFATSYRAVVDQGNIKESQWVAVWGCGGVGLSAVMIAAAFRARVVAVDIDDNKLEFAHSIGADAIVNSAKEDSSAAIRELTSGGAHVSIDALGHHEILYSSVASLRKRGKHIQLGIMEAGKHSAPIPIDLIIERELTIVGSHGMQAHRYPEMLELIRDGRLSPERLIGQRIPLEVAPNALMEMNRFSGVGSTVIDFEL
ncbi:MAG TPA: zinc-dependent alcohol dehydrogenase family protein [Pyrinomonadaceae bacterium]